MDNFKKNTPVPPPFSEKAIPHVKCLYQYSRDQFAKLFSDFPGQKLLLIDSRITPSLRCLMNRIDLQKHTIEAWRELVFPCTQPLPNLSRILLLGYPDLQFCSIFSHYVEILEKQIPHCVDRFYRFAFIPEPSETCVMEFARYSILRKIRMDTVSFPLHFIPLDDDLISLQYPYAFRDFHLLNDTSCLHQAAKCLIKLQTLFGKPTQHLRVIGSAASCVADFLVQLRRENELELSKDAQSNSSALHPTHLLNCDDIIKQQCMPPISQLLEKSQQRENDLSASTFSKNLLKQDPAAISKPSFTSTSAKKDTKPASQTNTNPFTLNDAPSALPLQEKLNFDESLDIDMIVLFDRRADYITPLCTPFTYASILEQMFGVGSGFIEVPPSILSTGSLSMSNQAFSSASESEIVKSRIHLDAKDPLFRDISGKNQQQIGKILHDHANEIQETYMQKEKLKNISDMNEFMKDFIVKQGEHASLANHVNLASYISKVTKKDTFTKILRLEDEILQSSYSSSTSQIIQSILNFIDQNINKVEIYRLLCLLSVIRNGVRPKYMEKLRTAIIQQYGYQEMELLSNLETVGLLRECVPNSNWSEIKKNFNLMVEESEIEHDIAFVCSGYAPLSIRLIQMLHSTPLGWRGLVQALNLLWGPALEIRLPVNQTVVKECTHESFTSHSAKKVSTIMVFFIGGVTFTEIAAIRKLVEIEKGARQILIATTDIIRSSSIFSNLEFFGDSNTLCAP